MARWFQEDLYADVNEPLSDCNNLQRVYCVLENLCSVAAILVEQLQAASVTVNSVKWIIYNFLYFKHINDIWILFLLVKKINNNKKISRILCWFWIWKNNWEKCFVNKGQCREIFECWFFHQKVAPCAIRG